MDKKTPVDRSETNKNSAGGNALPTSGESAATTRRRLLQAGGAGLAAAAVGATRGLAAPTIAGQSVIVPRAPNIVVIMTDQERHHMHWPPGWAEENLPSLRRLKRNGLYFLRAYTAACECSPSRGVIQTGRFAPVNRVPSTAVLWPGLVHQNRQPNIASLLKEHAGYDVVWKGKWHLSYASNAAPGNGGEDWGPADRVSCEAWPDQARVRGSRVSVSVDDELHFLAVRLSWAGAESRTIGSIGTDSSSARRGITSPSPGWESGMHV